MVREIQQNREFLEALVGKKLQYLCYPTGVWSKQRYGREKGTTLSERCTLARAGSDPEIEQANMGTMGTNPFGYLKNKPYQSQYSTGTSTNTVVA